MTKISYFNTMEFEKNGYALPFAIFISLLITGLLLGVLVTISFHNIQTIKLIEKRKLDLACFSAVQITLSDTVNNYTNESIVYIDSFKVRVTEDTIGLYKRIITKATGNFDSSKIIYWLSGTTPQIFQNALVTSKPNFRATVVGKTKIIGDWLSTSKRIEKGSLLGKTNTNQDFLQGKITIDKNLNPKIFNETLLKKLHNTAIDISRNLDGSGDDLKLDSIKNQFFKHTKIVEVNGNLFLTGNINSSKREKIKFVVRGNLITDENSNIEETMEIMCNGNVYINRGSTLKNIMIYSSDSVEIAPDCEFSNVQLFSERKICIDQAKFFYPSIVCLYQNVSDSTKLQSKIILRKSIFNGAIMLVTNSIGMSNNLSEIFIDKNSKIQGLLYSENNLELLGKVYGTVMTYNFRFVRGSDIYMNWLIDNEIDRSALSKWFEVPLGFSDIDKSFFICDFSKMY